MTLSRSLWLVCVCVCVCVVLCGVSDLHCELLKQKWQTNAASCPATSQSQQQSHLQSHPDKTHTCPNLACSINNYYKHSICTYFCNALILVFLLELKRLIFPVPCLKEWIYIYIYIYIIIIFFIQRAAVQWIFKADHQRFSLSAPALIPNFRRKYAVCFLLIRAFVPALGPATKKSLVAYKYMLVLLQTLHQIMHFKKNSYYRNNAL